MNIQESLSADEKLSIHELISISIYLIKHIESDAIVNEIIQPIHNFISVCQYLSQVNRIHLFTEFILSVTTYLCKGECLLTENELRIRMNNRRLRQSDLLKYLKSATYLNLLKSNNNHISKEFFTCVNRFIYLYLNDINTYLTEEFNYDLLDIDSNSSSEGLEFNKICLLLRKLEHACDLLSSCNQLLIFARTLLEIFLE